MTPNSQKPLYSVPRSYSVLQALISEKTQLILTYNSIQRVISHLFPPVRLILYTLTYHNPLNVFTQYATVTLVDQCLAAVVYLFVIRRLESASAERM